MASGAARAPSLTPQHLPRLNLSQVVLSLQKIRRSSVPYRSLSVARSRALHLHGRGEAEEVLL